MKLSKVAQTVPASPIRKLVGYAKEAKRRGVHIYHLNIGDPDIKTPAVMVEALKSWNINPIGYADSHGDSELIKSLLWYYGDLGFDDLEEENIQITSGGSEGLLWTFLSIAETGEEIIAYEPFYANYLSYAVMAGVNIKPILTKIDNGFHLPDKDIIESAITDKTRAILISSPGNPTGVVYTKEELDVITDLAAKYNLFVISDEVYREFVYDGKKSISLLSYRDKIREQIIIVDSLSKRYSLCGIRVGAVVSYNKNFMESILKYAQARLSTGLVDQKVSSKLTHVDGNYFNAVRAEYQIRRNTLVDGLRKIKGVVCPKPEGAFYIIVGLPIDDSEDFAKWLLTDFNLEGETVMVAPAAGFYQSKDLGKREVRIAYVLKKESLERSVEILEKALKKYNRL